MGNVIISAPSVVKKTPAATSRTGNDPARFIRRVPMTRSACRFTIRDPGPAACVR